MSASTSHRGKLTLESTLTLPNPSSSSSSSSTSSIKIPRLGFGVYRSPEDVCEKSCLTALEAGYRHIDSAQFYANESQVGSAVGKSGVPRDQVFITTKILSPGGSVEKSYAKCVDSVNKINGASGQTAEGKNGGYVDLFLIHSPNAGPQARKEMWLALEKLYEEGKAKAIGVSNYGMGHIEEIKDFGKVWPPQVNQIEQKEIVEYCHKNGIVVEAYSPLVRNYKANDQTLLGLAKKYNKTTAQVLIRYCLQKDWVPLPKSDTPERIEANAKVYDFEISDDDMRVLNDLDQGEAGAIVQVVDNS